MDRAALRKGEPAVSAALAGGASYVSAALAGGISVNTIRRRMAEPDYAAAVLALRAEMLACAVGRLASTAEAAALTLQELLAEDSPPQARLGAARAIFEYLGRFGDVAVLEQRIAVLEADRGTQRLGSPAGLHIVEEKG